jgi:hypothetical protein
LCTLYPARPDKMSWQLDRNNQALRYAFTQPRNAHCNGHLDNEDASYGMF